MVEFSTETETLVLTRTSHIGGAERSLLEFLRHVPERTRPRLGVVLPDRDGPLFTEIRELDYEIRTCDLPRRTLPIPQPITYARWVRRVRGLIEASSIDTVYANGLSLGPLLTPLKMIPPGTRTVIHVRDHRHPIGLLFRTVVLQDEVIFNSEFVRDQGLRFPISESVFPFTSHVVYNSADVRMAEKQRDAGTPDVRFADSEVVLGMFGRFVPWKKFALAIEHCCRSEIYELFDRFIVVGAESGLGNPAYERTIAEVVAENDPENKFEVLKFKENVWPYYALCDVIVVPSENEPFGRIPIEAGALGIPVLVADSGGLPEVVRDGETGLLFDHNDPETFSRQLRKLLTNESLRHRLGADLRRDVEFRFSSERYYAAIRSIVLK